MQISVIIPTFNRYSVLDRALRSVFAQSYDLNLCEIIVIDDGSTDRSLNIKQDFPAIRYFYQKNKGVSSARNFGVKKAKFEWIAFLDSDDEWEKDKLKEQVNFHLKNPEIKISYTDERWIRDGEDINIPKKFAKYSNNIFEHSLSHCIIAPSSTIIEKKLFNKVGMFDETLEVCEDYDLWLRISLSEEIGLVDKKLIVKYGGAQDQLSMKYWGMDRFRIVTLEKLLEFNTDKKDLIMAMLKKKLKVLLKGSIKYNRDADIQKYQFLLERYDIY